jgi:hypothetical protein
VAQLKALNTPGGRRSFSDLQGVLGHGGANAEDRWGDSGHPEADAAGKL